ncbi:hypothetical protein GEMRC1_013372 [Eukaryota sp. GEM-RC1]
MSLNVALKSKVSSGSAPHVIYKKRQSTSKPSIFEPPPVRLLTTPRRQVSSEVLPVLDGREPFSISFKVPVLSNQIRSQCFYSPSKRAYGRQWRIKVELASESNRVSFFLQIDRFTENSHTLVFILHSPLASMSKQTTAEHIFNSDWGYKQYIRYREVSALLSPFVIEGELNFEVLVYPPKVAIGMLAYSSRRNLAWEETTQRRVAEPLQFTYPVTKRLSPLTFRSVSPEFLKSCRLEGLFEREKPISEFTWKYAAPKISTHSAMQTKSTSKKRVKVPA